MTTAQSAIERFKTHRAKVGVLGLGYAGLPLACRFAEAGFETFGFDTDREKISALKRGQSYIRHIPTDRLSALVSARKLIPDSRFDDLKLCDATIICVPTPLGEGRSPDLRHVVNTARAAAQHLHKGQLVALESTTYPGTTNEVVLPIMKESGLSVGEDFFLS